MIRRVSLGLLVVAGVGVCICWPSVFWGALIVGIFGLCFVEGVQGWRRLQQENLRVDRVATGCCPACGYDLRATPERCPECGAVPGAGISNRDTTLG
jgi:hypothetical protein